MPSAATWVDIPYVIRLRFPSGSLIEPCRRGSGYRLPGRCVPVRLAEN